MATVDLTDVRPNGDSFAEDRLSPPAELWAPPLAPFEDEDAFLAPEPSRRKLIASTAIVAALGAAVLTYFFLASGAKAPSATSPIASSPTGVPAARSDVFLHRSGGADRNEAAALHGKTFGERGTGIGSEYLAIEDDEIGGLGERAVCGRQFDARDGTSDERGGASEMRAPRRHVMLPR